MNIYRTEFFSVCPVNCVRIKYALEIYTKEQIKVEQIIDEVTLLHFGYHEEHADQLLRAFGGVQKLTADHHGVSIETIRDAHTAADQRQAAEAQAAIAAARRITVLGSSQCAREATAALDISGAEALTAAIEAAVAPYQHLLDAVKQSASPHITTNDQIRICVDALERFNAAIRARTQP